MAPTGRVLRDLACSLVQRGHEVTVICSRRSYDGGKLYPAREQLEGVRVIRLSAFGFGRRGFVGKLLDYGSFYLNAALKLLFLKPRPDLIVGLTTPPYIGLLGKIAAGLRGARHAHWIMDIYPDVMLAQGMLRENSLFCRFLKALTRRQLKESSLTLVPGPDMAHRLKAYMDGANNPEWVPLWGDSSLVPRQEDAADPLVEECNWNAEKLVLMYSGNMGLGHRFGEFLSATERLGADGPIWVFAGGGKRRIEIERFHRTNPGLPLQLLPYVPREQLRDHLCSADVHLASLDADWQGCMVPSKLHGIFSVGRPVIFVGARSNSLAQWIDESGGGWVVEPDDVDGLVAAIKEAGESGERVRRGVAARRFAQEHFDMQKNCQLMAALFENACAE